MSFLAVAGNGDILHAHLVEQMTRFVHAKQAAASSFCEVSRESLQHLSNV